MVVHSERQFLASYSECGSHRKASSSGRSPDVNIGVMKSLLDVTRSCALGADAFRQRGPRMRYWSPR